MVATQVPAASQYPIWQTVPVPHKSQLPPQATPSHGLRGQTPGVTTHWPFTHAAVEETQLPSQQVWQLSVTGHSDAEVQALAPPVGPPPWPVAPPA